MNIRNIRTHAEFEKVLERINASVRGIVIDAAVSDCASLERFEGLEFVVLEGHRLSRFWNTAKNPQLRMITVWMNSTYSHLRAWNMQRSLNICGYLLTFFLWIVMQNLRRKSSRFLRNTEYTWKRAEIFFHTEKENV